MGFPNGISYWDFLLGFPIGISYWDFLLGFPTGISYWDFLLGSPFHLAMHRVTSEYLVAKIGVDTAENEPSKVSGVTREFHLEFHIRILPDLELRRENEGARIGRLRVAGQRGFQHEPMLRRGVYAEGRQELYPSPARPFFDLKLCMVRSPLYRRLR